MFVPHGSPAPDSVRGPDWFRVSATFVPRGSGRTTASGAPWPRDRAGRDWPKDRYGRRICPLTDMAPGVRAPGEAAPEFGDPVAAFLAMAPAFDDPAGAAGMVQLAAGGGRASATAEGEPVLPAVPDDDDKQWLVPRQAGKQPVYDIFVGGFGDETIGNTVLNYARNEAQQHRDNVVYFPWDVNPTALARYIDSLPPDARINVIGHSWGGDTAAKAVAATAKGVDLLITIDPVSAGRPDMAAVEARAGQWIDVDAVPEGGMSLPDSYSGHAGKWGPLPQGTADVYIAAPFHHEQFTRMMGTARPNGTSPQQALRGPASR